MPSSAEPTTLRVALIGTPNTGKSTLFGALVGVHQRVGNYPGVTVEKRTGRMDHGGRRYEVVDLPGLYSLAPRSQDEMVAVDLLLGRGEESVSAVICIVDAANLRRQLYLVSQVLELGLPTVLAVNMVDVAEQHGIRLDLPRLQQRLAVPVVATQANRRLGIAELKTALADVVGGPSHGGASPLPDAFEGEVTRLESLLGRLPSSVRNGRPIPRYLVRRLLLDVSGYLQEALLSDGDGERVRESLAAARGQLAAQGSAVPTVETTARHEWARRVLDGVVTHPGEYVVTTSDRIDRVLTHRLWGTIVFVTVMVVLFQGVFVWAEPVMNWIDGGVRLVGGWIESHLAEGALRSLLVDGVLGGVGGVLVFLPQIMILFLFIAVLEDCGYMARAAYLMDKVMARVGLSGKSFIPMLSSFACAIPGIMAARVIENERDRLTTILVAPLLTCSARLPIYALLIAAFIPSRKYVGGVLSLQGLTLAALYALGIVTAVVVALLLKKTILRGETPPFLMELPSYQWPSARNITYRVLQRAFLFIRCAGTLILAVSMVVWAASYYPHDADVVEAPFRPEIERLEARLDTLPPGDPGRQPVSERLGRLEHEIAGAYQRQSVLGRLGRLIEPAFKPLGWDWRIGSAVIASFPAREIVVATLGVVLNVGEDPDAQTDEGLIRLTARLRAATWDGTDRRLFTVPVAVSIMVFYALCAQCAATLAVIRRETNSWRWPLFTFSYMTTLAYAAALITYQVGTWISR